MARIRTIKPEFFRHAELYDAEVETGLPLRVAFAGLWTVCDRRGRFKWKPRELKLDVLPHDLVDFSRVLDALTTRGFVVCYASQGEEHGWIPTFEAHQVINNREAESILPEPPPFEPDKARVNHASATRHDLAQAEGKGREGKGKEGKGNDASFDALGVHPPEGWSHDEWGAIWPSWVRHRIEIRHKLTETSTKAQVVQLGKWGPVKGTSAIEEAIQKGWQGFFEPKAQPVVLTVHEQKARLDTALEGILD